MNPFETHGIQHLSPSSCNTFVSSPAMFVLQKVLKRTPPVGAAAFRGSVHNECVAAAGLGHESHAVRTHPVDRAFHPSSFVKTP